MTTKMRFEWWKAHAIGAQRIASPNAPGDSQAALI